MSAGTAAADASAEKMHPQMVELLEILMVREREREREREICAINCELG